MRGEGPNADDAPLPASYQGTAPPLALPPLEDRRVRTWP